MKDVSKFPKMIKTLKSLGYDSEEILEHITDLSESDEETHIDACRQISRSASEQCAKKAPWDKCEYDVQNIAKIVSISDEERIKTIREVYLAIGAVADDLREPVYDGLLFKYTEHPEAFGFSLTQAQDFMHEIAEVYEIEC